MNSLKIIAVLLIVAGGLAIGYGGFSYTKETHSADVAGIHLEVNEKQRVNVPLWAGLGAIVIGAVLLVNGRKV